MPLAINEGFQGLVDSLSGKRDRLLGIHAGGGARGLRLVIERLDKNVRVQTGLGRIAMMALGGEHLECTIEKAVARTILL